MRVSGGRAGSANAISLHKYAETSRGLFAVMLVQWRAQGRHGGLVRFSSLSALILSLRDASIPAMIGIQALISGCRVPGRDIRGLIVIEGVTTSQCRILDGE